jgi:hypothetical protein
MDPLQVKALIDIDKGFSSFREDEFYRRHSCDWLHCLKRIQQYLLNARHHAQLNAQRVKKVQPS